jgi:hypothetical protein
MVWQPSHSAAPPEWNANATPLNQKVMSQASIRIRLILNFILICPSLFTPVLREPGCRREAGGFVLPHYDRLTFFGGSITGRFIVHFLWISEARTVFRPHKNTSYSITVT